MAISVAELGGYAAAFRPQAAGHTVAGPIAVAGQRPDRRDVAHYSSNIRRLCRLAYHAPCSNVAAGAGAATSLAPHPCAAGCVVMSSRSGLKGYKPSGGVGQHLMAVVVLVISATVDASGLSPGGNNAVSNPPTTMPPVRHGAPPPSTSSLPAANPATPTGSR